MGFIADVLFIDNVQLHKPLTNVDKVKKNRAKFLTKTELKELLGLLNAINPHIAMICEFQSLTGLRFGELAALHTQDYAKENKIINHFILSNKARILWNATVAKNDYIFVTDVGLPYDLHFVNKIIKRIGFYKPVSTHTFRYTHITY